MGRGTKEERPLPYNYSFPYNVVYLKCMTTLGTRGFFLRATGSFVSSAAGRHVFGRRWNNASLVKT